MRVNCFWITIDNIRDYTDCDSTSQIDFITPSELILTMRIWEKALGWQTHERKSMEKSTEEW